jgi:hypothetical protein
MGTPILTTLVNFDTKWKKIIHPSTPVPTPPEKEYDKVVGVFEGGGYRQREFTGPRWNVQ